MKINLSDIDTEQFNIKEHTVAGETVYLVNPNSMGCEWTKSNLHLRSSVWNSEGELISAGFKKFFNMGEKPKLTYTPFSLTAHGGCELMEKLDGSLLIVSKYKGELIIRTRGVIDAKVHTLTAPEIEMFKEKYPKAFDFLGLETSHYSLLFEWTTPKNRIVIDYGSEPELYLVGSVNHEDYTLEPQNALDEIAEHIFGVKRPKRFKFDTVKEMMAAVEEFKGCEGICCYSPDGQSIRKIKGAEYLMLHRFKAGASLKNVLDLFFEYGRPSRADFEKRMLEEFDFECWSMIEGYVSDVYSATNNVAGQLDVLIAGAEQYVDMERRDSAPLIMKNYTKLGANVIFKTLDGKEISDTLYKSLLKFDLRLT